MRRLFGHLPEAAFVAVLALGLGLIAFAPPSNAADRVEISMRFSRYEPPMLAVPVGRPVVFVLRNDDPIDHEWMIGDEAMHERHRTGTEPYHGSIPTEVTVPALSTVETILFFDEPVTWRYVCHLPGHEAYGMVGVLTAR